MSYTAEELLVLATDFAEKAVSSLAKCAKSKLDPKAKVRNRGTVCVPAESAKDKKDHFPINNEAQARNALARVNQYSSVPDWYSGSLASLVKLVARKVHSKYPKIEISDKAKKPGKNGKKKKAFDGCDNLLIKYAQSVNSEGKIDWTETAPSSETRDFGDVENWNLNPETKELGDVENWKLTPQEKATFESTKAKMAPIPYRNDVWQAQRRLQRPPFNINLVADGKLGPQTREALKAYKKSINIPSLEDEAAISALKSLPEVERVSEPNVDKVFPL